VESDLSQDSGVSPLGCGVPPSELRIWQSHCNGYSEARTFNRRRRGGEGSRPPHQSTETTNL